MVDLDDVYTGGYRALDGGDVGGLEVLDITGRHGCRCRVAGTVGQCTWSLDAGGPSVELCVWWCIRSARSGDTMEKRDKRDGDGEGSPLPERPPRQDYPPPPTVP